MDKPQTGLIRRTFAVPMLAVRDAAGALEFYGKAFGARETVRLQDPAGVVQHAEIVIEGAPIMLAEESPEHNRSPETLGGSSVIIQLEVADADALIAQAVAAGAELLRPAEDQFYGQRTGKIRDPYGHVWMLSTPIEEISYEEMHKRFNAFFS